MPNYTKNSLKISGPADMLRYFYEKNRVTAEDIKFMEEVYGPYEYDLSFEKSVPRHNYQITTDYLQKILFKAVNAGKPSAIEWLPLPIESETSGLRSPPLTAQAPLPPSPPVQLKYDGWDYYVYLWGTKSDAIEPTAYLEYIDGKEDHLGIRTQGYITYTFDTAWSYPEMWLKAVANLYPKLKFEHSCLNEDDGYETEHTIIYEGGKLVSETSANRVEQLMEERGGVEEVMKNLLRMMDSEPLKIDYRELVEEAIRREFLENSATNPEEEQELDYVQVLETAFYTILHEIDSIKAAGFDMLLNEYMGFAGSQVIQNEAFAKKFVEYIRKLSA